MLRCAKVKVLKDFKGVVSVTGHLFVNGYLSKSGSYSPTEPGARGLSFLMIKFQKDGSQVLEKDISGLLQMHYRGKEMGLQLQVF